MWLFIQNLSLQILHIWPLGQLSCVQMQSSHQICRVVNWQNPVANLTSGHNVFLVSVLRKTAIARVIEEGVCCKKRSNKVIVFFFWHDVQFGVKAALALQSHHRWPIFRNSPCTGRQIFATLAATDLKLHRSENKAKVESVNEEEWLSLSGRSGLWGFLPHSWGTETVSHKTGQRRSLFHHPPSPGAPRPLFPTKRSKVINSNTIRSLCHNQMVAPKKNKTKQKKHSLASIIEDRPAFKC